MRAIIKYWLALLLIIPSIVTAIELQVNIKGTSSDLTKSIRTDLHLQQAISEPKLTEVMIQNLFALSNEQIHATLEAKGYYNSTIESNLTLKNGATPEQDTWVATFTITPGKTTKIHSVSVDI